MLQVLRGITRRRPICPPFRRSPYAAEQDLDTMTRAGGRRQRPESLQHEAQFGTAPQRLRMGGGCLMSANEMKPAAAGVVVEAVRA